MDATRKHNPQPTPRQGRNGTSFNGAAPLMNGWTIGGDPESGSQTRPLDSPRPPAPEGGPQASESPEATATMADRIALALEPFERRLHNRLDIALALIGAVVALGQIFSVAGSAPAESRSVWAVLALYGVLLAALFATPFVRSQPGQRRAGAPLRSDSGPPGLTRTAPAPLDPGEDGCAVLLYAFAPLNEPAAPGFKDKFRLWKSEMLSLERPLTGARIETAQYEERSEIVNACVKRTRRTFTTRLMDHAKGKWTAAYTLQVDIDDKYYTDTQWLSGVTLIIRHRICEGASAVDFDALQENLIKAYVDEILGGDPAHRAALYCEKFGFRDVEAH